MNATNNATPMITTQNETWGFYGTLLRNEVGGAAALFDEAARELMARFGLTADEARDVLDGRIGRHMADQHCAGESALALIARLCEQGWWRDIQMAIREVRS